MKEEKQQELLSPAGSKESVYAAVNNGCDAIYIGGKNFNARKYASNFSDDELAEIIDFCHIRCVKVFITLNILYKDCEINDVLKFASKMYCFGADAFIVQDIGIFNILKSNFPLINLHASTQMTAHNIYTVNFLSKLGFDRVVLSRELSLDEIKDIAESSSIEIEVFVHGALCVSYSGRCLMSSFIGGRSGNRGQCAQPCRMNYSLYKNNKKIAENYIISPKDIMTLKEINELISSGIKSFKIEGRMKKPEYVAQVTKTYRKYIDIFLKNESYSFDLEDIEKLTQIFNRGGDFSEGYLKNWAGTKMISSSPKSSGILIGVVENYNQKSQKAEIILSKSLNPGDGIEIWTEKEPHVGMGISRAAKAGDKISVKIKGRIKKGNFVYKSYDKVLNDELKKDYQNDVRKRRISVFVIAKLNSPLKLRLSCEDILIDITGYMVQPAEKNPITKNDLIKRLSKTGGTPYIFDFKEIICDENIYIPISEINSIKRKAVLLLNSKIAESYKRKSPKISYNFKRTPFRGKKYLTVHLSTEEQLYAVLNYNIKRIYFEFNEFLLENLEKCVKISHKNNIEFFICFPSIYRKCFFDNFNKIYSLFEKSNADGYLLRNFGEIKTSKKIVSDYTFNVFNGASLEFMNSLFDEITLSPELTLSEIENIASEKTEIVIYGKLTLMTTHQCPIGLYDAGKKEGMFCKLKNNKDNYYLRDRMGALFPIQKNCQMCVTSILNCVPLCLLNQFNEIMSISTKYLRIILTDEDKKTIDDLLYSHIKLLDDGILDERVKRTIDTIRKTGFTKGHLINSTK